MKEWVASDLSGLDLLVIQIDGIHMDEDLILVAAVSSRHVRPLPDHARSCARLTLWRRYRDVRLEYEMPPGTCLDIRHRLTLVR